MFGLYSLIDDKESIMALIVALSGVYTQDLSNCLFFSAAHRFIGKALFSCNSHSIAENNNAAKGARRCDINKQFGRTWV
jgi:hypothetical protein